ncbi:MAG: hypothetical protein DSY42_04705 [Aquifex sp.]|nr:MAG: hypothetical protein DSY42_04705 [Aquifex sp.]
MLFILDSNGGEIGFFIKGKGNNICIVGKHDDNKEEALLGRNLRFFTLSHGKVSFSYTVEVFKGKCLAGVVFREREKMKIALVLYNKNVEKIIYFSSTGNLMLWQILKTDKGFLMAGGVKESNWDAFIVFLNRNFKVVWKNRLHFSEEYFYSVAVKGEKVFAVGRVKKGENWEALITVFSKEGKLLESYTLGEDYKDYLRYVKNLEGQLIAVGRSEDGSGNSDLLIYDFSRYYLYDLGEYDYGRSISAYGNGFIIAGETRFNGNNDGIFLILDKHLNPIRAYKIGWEGTDAVRFLDYPYFVGYTYSFSFSSDLLFGIFEEDFK